MYNFVYGTLFVQVRISKAELELKLGAGSWKLGNRVRRHFDRDRWESWNNNNAGSQR